MSRDLKVIERHLRRWQDQSLVDDALAERLREASRGMDKEGASTVMRTALAALGGGLLLSGLVLVVAENWEALHRFVKLGAWAVILFLLLAAAQLLSERFPDRPALADALAAVAGGWILAGIALVSQIYHLNSRPPNGLWLWLVLLLPAAWLLPRRGLSLAILTAMMAALTAEVGEPRSFIHAAHQSPVLWIGLPLLGYGAASWLPRPLPGLRSLMGAWVFGVLQVSLLVLGAMQDLDDARLGHAWWVVGAGLAMALAWPRRVWPDTFSPSESRVLLLAGLLPWAILAGEYTPGRIVDELAVGVSWILQIALAMLVIRAGGREGSRAWVNLGYLALLLGILTRYFDFFGAYLEGGLALVVTGLLMLFVLYVLEKARRRTLMPEAVTA
jgi:uncharacterized membrane protein